MSGIPTTGMHSIMLKSTLEFPASGASLQERALAKPPTLFQPHAQPVSQMTPPRPQPLEDEDEATERPSPLKSQPRRIQAQYAKQISVSSRPRQWLPGQQEGGSTLLLSPRESSSILAAARVVGEHGASRLDADSRIETGKQESAWQILKAEQLENARIMAVLKAREEEIDSLHELLWCSEVAPSQASLACTANVRYAGLILMLVHAHTLSCPYPYTYCCRANSHAGSSRQCLRSSNSLLTCTASS